MLDDLSYYDENIPCLAACPVHTNAGMYVAAIADGDDELAYLTELDQVDHAAWGAVLEVDGEVATELDIARILRWTRCSRSPQAP